MGYTLQELRNIRDRYRRLKAEKERYVNRLSDEIERLQRAKNILENLEDGAIKQLVKHDVPIKNSGAGLSWRGGSKDSFDAQVTDVAYQAGKTFRKNVDRMTDDLNWEITKRKDKRDLANGKIFDYTKTIRWAVTAIENLFD